ncbi:IclR family transcriptional regulator [Micromonospora sp. MA102]|uniref:IclR family transcriptional regulator n=1 Tax=Micromonospora sp. MA102 TaxID=2952755 RepID=UPI0021CA4C3C|nr:IclR family transcriptional regulator [Micromonospora sp. MA102]
MQNQRLQDKPSYAIESVDNALRLLQVIRDEGSIRVKQAATELGVAQSTAHRLLSMLVYRGFAAQDESRAYVPGPSLGVGPARYQWTHDLRVVSEPHMQALSRELGETVNLMIRVGTVVRFLLTIEGPQMLRVGDRQGAVVPASAASGGKALLATLDNAILERLYRNESTALAEGMMKPAEFTRFIKKIELVRLNGYAINFEETEAGVAAIGMVVRGASGNAIGAISLGIPTSRFRKLLRTNLVSRVSLARDGIERDLATLRVDVGGNSSYVS